MKLKLPGNLNVFPRAQKYLPRRPPSRFPDPLVNNPNAAYQQVAEDVTFIHRPPPTMPSPHSFTTAPASPLLRSASSSVNGLMPPALQKPRPEQPKVLSDEELARLRELRKADPGHWTRRRLAKEFGCSPMFVKLVAPLSKQARRAATEKRESEHDEARSTWGPRKALVRDARRRRREFW
ncbi:uncharacterized protein LAESUDRAFT_723088 [Laetiporus sulphureus 93-53]|uniref:Mitochondrial ribosomal protein subunit L20-domain-containing protein n=1 Tax=Laetiporus sulphureus 93-53 TaxID=1314785 RepID=A0A165FSC5_9APHY|nr:uncharacterized protein LAESUDRAFT_723088 [Laetiporus sulphureus 93-53]KZT09349.1 hypothetical protein LAESUDRAFT_723088 [Laetiporus sulphureus 93-53]